MLLPIRDVSLSRTGANYLKGFWRLRVLHSALALASSWTDACVRTPPYALAGLDFNTKWAFSQAGLYNSRVAVDSLPFGQVRTLPRKALARAVYLLLLTGFYPATLLIPLLRIR